MNEIEQAIAGFETDNALLAGSREVGTIERNKLALTALREKAEREKGCEYCFTGTPIEATAGWLEDNEFRIDDGKLTYAAYVDDAGGALYDDTPINFCPMCGRKL